MLQPPLSNGNFRQVKDGLWDAYEDWPVANRKSHNEKFKLYELEYMTSKRQPATTKLGKHKAKDKTKSNRETRDDDETEPISSHRSSPVSNENKTMEEVVVIDDEDEPTWEEQYQELTAFEATHHHCCPSLVKDASKSLRDWTHQQRTEYCKRILEGSKIKKLEKLGFVFHTNAAFYEKTWIELYNLFQMKAGSVRKDDRLQKWISYQRRQMRQGKLLCGRKKRLQEIGFPFETPSDTTSQQRPRQQPNSQYESASEERDISDDSDDNMEEGEINEQSADGKTWEEHYDNLVAFQTKHHHCIPELVEYQTLSFCRWANEQRGHKDDLSVSQKKKLDAIGFSWADNALRFEKMWISNYAKLRDLMESNGDCLFVDKSLRKWMAAQRSLDNGGKLLFGRKERLESIGFFNLSTTKKRGLGNTASVSVRPKKKERRASPLPQETSVAAQNTKRKQSVESKPNVKKAHVIKDGMVKNDEIRDPFDVLGPLAIELDSLQVNDSCLDKCYSVLETFSTKQGCSSKKKKLAMDAGGNTFARLLSQTRDLRGALMDPQDLNDCVMFLQMMVIQAHKTK